MMIFLNFEIIMSEQLNRAASTKVSFVIFFI